MVARLPNRRPHRAAVRLRLGKAQRLLAGLDPSIGPILLHGATWPICDIYRSLGIDLPPYEHATIEQAKLHKGGRW